MPGRTRITGNLPNLLTYDASGNITTTGTISASGGTVSYLPLSGGVLTGELTGTSASFTGSMGVGTNAPSVKLDVFNGDIALGSKGEVELNSNIGTLGFWTNDANLGLRSVASIYVENDGPDYWGGGTTNWSTRMKFRVLSQNVYRDAVTIANSGYVGIGTTSPGGVLDVRLNQNATTNVYLRNTDNTNSSSRMYLNLVAGNSSAGLAVLAGGTSSGDFYIGGINGGNTYFQPYLGGGVTMTLTNGGLVGVGTTTPAVSFNVGHNSHGIGIAYMGSSALPSLAGLYTDTNASGGGSGYGDLIIKARTDYGGFYGVNFFTAASDNVPVLRMRVASNGQIVTYGGQTGGYVRVDSGYVNETKNVTNNCTSYFFYKYTGGSNGSSTTYFNITGVSTANGTWLDVVMRARKDATGSAINTSMYVQINGTNIEYHVANGTAAVQTDKKIRIVRMSDEWLVLSTYTS